LKYSKNVLVFEVLKLRRRVLSATGFEKLGRAKKTADVVGTIV